MPETTPLLYLFTMTDPSLNTLAILTFRGAIKSLDSRVMKFLKWGDVAVVAAKRSACVLCMS